MFAIQRTSIDQISFRWYLVFKGNMHKCNFHYEAMPDNITDFEICGFHKNTKIKYLENKENILFTHQGLLYFKK